ncbi:MAG: hypothetical protein ABI629_20190 [bacterium]
MKHFPGFERLYELHDPMASRPYRGKFEYDGGFKLSRYEATVDRSVRVVWAMGSSTPSDVVWTTSGYPLIVSSRVIELLEMNKLTGWTTYPVDVFDKRDKPCTGYAGLAVVGRCGRIDLASSRIILREYPGGSFPRFLGHFFERESWDGVDFCCDSPDHKGNASMTRIVTEEVVALFKRHRISNIRCERLTEVSVDTSVYEMGLGYLLPKDFKARVASAYDAVGVAPPESYR